MTDDDYELLELAAKAAGYKTAMMDKGYDFLQLCVVDGAGFNNDEVWSPLDDDGDALRLAVKLGLVVCVLNEISRTGIYLPAEHVGGKYDVVECHDGEPYAATRRAIVLAAAEIGKSKQAAT